MSENRVTTVVIKLNDKPVSSLSFIQTTVVNLCNGRYENRNGVVVLWIRSADPSLSSVYQISYVIKINMYFLSI